MFFQINVTPKAQNATAAQEKAPEVQAVLVLAPFQPQPRLNIETSENIQGQTSLVIKNTSNRPLNVKVSKPPPEDRCVILSASEMVIPPESSSTLFLSWTPLKAGSWRDTLQLTDSRRLKYDIPLTTTCISKKSSKTLKPHSQKILAPCNSNPPLLHRKSQQKVPANKENISRSQKLPSNSFLKASQSSTLASTGENSILKPSNVRANKNNQNPYRSHQNLEENHRNFHQHLDISGVLNSSSFQLTPLKSTKPNNNPQDFDFSPRDTSSISPGQPSLPHRRDTYLNPDPKFCRVPPLEPVSQEPEEDFDDSLSPRPEDHREAGNFSALIDDLASFKTPQKSQESLENGGLTVTRTVREEITFSNNTFEISGSRGQLQFCFETPGGAGYAHNHTKNNNQHSENNGVHDLSGTSTSSRILMKNREYSSQDWSPGGAGHHQNHHSINYFPPETDTEGFLHPNHALGVPGNKNHQRNHDNHSRADHLHNFSGISASLNSLKSSQEDLVRQNRHGQSEPPEFPSFNPKRHSSVEDFTSSQNFHQLSNSPLDLSRQSDFDCFLRPTKHSKSFGRISPVCGSSPEPTRPISSSPIHSVRTSDTSTVQQVIEADLWLKDEPKTPLRHQKSISLESISEEPSFKRQTSLPHLNFNLNLTKTFTSPLKPTVFEISPTKKSSGSMRGFKSINYHRVSPKKPSRVMKGTRETQQILRKTKMHLNIQKGIPGVKIGKLSLAKLHKPKEKPKEVSVKLHNPEDLISSVFNPDPFAATMTEDPFLASSLYYDEKWMWNQEIEFKKWLNALLTPPEHLNADVDSGKVDVGKVWQSCRTKESIPLAETREAVSARYHTNHRLNTLRKGALMMFSKPEVRSVLSKTILSIEKGNLVVRQDKDLHRDIGLQKDILELFFSYNPLWLRIGLEVVYGETIPLASNNDLVGLTKFLLARFFNDPFLSEKFSHQNSTLKTPNFMPNLNKFILKKFLLLVYFLDVAKRGKLIGHDPCLFHKKALFKESREILLNFSRQTLSGVGDITKMLKPHGYVLTHKQTYLDEYDYAVKDLSVDLRDGVRLCRVMELIIGGKTLTSKCRAPAISRLQKVHNAEVALSALHEAGYVITGEIDAKSVADGHREKTMSLLWQIIYKFQAPRFEKAAKTLQKWWRAHLCYILVRNYLRRRRTNAVIIIQCCWRSYRAKKIFRALKTQRELELLQKNEAAKVIQTWWRSLKDRRAFLKTKTAAMTLQRAWRRYSTSKPYLQDLQRKKNAAVVIQRLFRSYKVMKSQRNDYLETRGAALMLQRWFRACSQGRKDLETFQSLKKSTILIQRTFRANKCMKFHRNNYLRVLSSVTTIQTWWRAHLLTKKTRNEFIIKKHSVRIISGWYSGLQLMKIERKSFLEKRKAAVVIQRAFRRFRETRRDRRHLKNVLKLSVILQTWWRKVRHQREFKIKQKSAVVIQKWFRSSKITKKLREDYLQLKLSAIVIQKNFRMKKTREKYLRMKRSVSTIEKWYSRTKTAKTVREEFLTKKNAVIVLQRWFRGLRETRKRQEEFLELRRNVLKVQTLWRAKILARKTRAEFLGIKNAVLNIQTISRGILARQRFRVLQDRERAAKILQGRWRARKIGQEIKKNYLKKRELIVCIQRRLRATLAARRCQREFEVLRKAVVVVQRRFRAQRVMRITRKSFLEKKMAVISLQSFVRMRKCHQEYQMLKTAVLVVQRRRRAHVLATSMRKDYLELKKATISVQKKFRAKLEGKRVREGFLRLKKSVILIQRTWRAKLRAWEREEAAVVLQTWWRSILIARRARNSFVMKRKSAVVIQRFFRGWRAARTKRKEFQQLRTASTVIQRAWRVFLARRRRRELINMRRNGVSVIVQWWRAITERRKLRAELRETLRWRNWAAGVIQATWRGYKVRKEQSSRIQELRIRSKRAAEAALPSTTVAYRLEEAMNGLMTFNNVGQLSMCLACIDSLTRLSIKGCVMFCKLQLVEKIYDLLEQSNRSLPWMDVCLRCTNILITLAKLPDTAGEVRKLEYMETIARLMNVTIKGQLELFLNLATLLWVVMGNEEFKKMVANDQRTVWLIRSACSAAVKKEKTPVKRKNTSMERIIVLPNPKPDWGLANRRPRCFLKVEHAVCVIMEMFGIQSFAV
ncbi:protein abnormal spindle [Fopius arisanus]|uniref:Protein abnormal spindle n=1 Tax=Fopius arisanus TaxID=64838 RepID=A0A9R1T401_9HYME|nr:PREDICTED: protein abnormal spindle [Fopius arisanus]